MTLKSRILLGDGTSFTFFRQVLLFLLSFLILTTTVPSTGLAGPNTTEPSPSPRPDFKKRKIKIGPRTIVVEIADTDERRAYGLMFQKKLATDAGMLFIFDDEQPRSFWMVNTLIPLSIGYFGRDKVLNEVIDMQPAVMGTARPKTYPSQKKTMYALEMNVGWYERNKIRPGVSFKFADN